MKVELFCGDCKEIMNLICSVDVVVADPPYGIGEDSYRVASRTKLAKTKDYGPFSWDKKLDKSYIDKMLSISKNQVIFGGNYYADWLPASSSWIVWDKLNSGNFADCELAWTSHNKAVRKFSYLWNGMIKQKPEERFHPTQKPLALMLWVIENYTREGDTVLDPTMGSGTTGVACVQLGRNFIGIDNNPVYFGVADQRIKIAQQQMRIEFPVTSEPL